MDVVEKKFESLKQHKDEKQDDGSSLLTSCYFYFTTALLHYYAAFIPHNTLNLLMNIDFVT